MSTVLTVESHCGMCIVYELYCLVNFNLFIMSWAHLLSSVELISIIGNDISFLLLFPLCNGIQTWQKQLKSSKTQETNFMLLLTILFCLTF